jgi:hypothetical protein
LWRVRRSRCRSQRWQLRQQRLYLLRKDMTVETGKFRTAPQGAQLIHEQERARRVGTFPFGLRSVDQPNVPGVHRALTVLESDGLGQQLPERTGGVPVVLNLRVVQ